MAAPEGNKFALGKGRPPKDFSDEDVHRLGEELISWIKSTEKFFHITQWYAIEKNMLKCDWDSLKQRASFFPYYKTAVEMMAMKTMSNEKMQTSYGNRFLGVYSEEIREHEKAIRDEKNAILDQALSLVDLKRAVEKGDIKQE